MQTRNWLTCWERRSEIQDAERFTSHISAGLLATCQYPLPPLSSSSSLSSSLVFLLVLYTSLAQFVTSSCTLLFVSTFLHITLRHFLLSSAFRSGFSAYIYIKLPKFEVSFDSSLGSSLCELLESTFFSNSLILLISLKNGVVLSNYPTVSVLLLQVLFFFCCL